LIEIKGLLSTASTLSENLLLEYTEGMDKPSVGWGCANEAKIRSLIDLHTAAVDFAQRTPIIAKWQASNLPDQIRYSMEQAISGRTPADTLSKPEDKALFLIGRDTNIINIAGALGMTWILDGRRHDTLPGGSLIFELEESSAAEYYIRVYYTAQTLEQMRDATVLTVDNSPPAVPPFLPGCSGEYFFIRGRTFRICFLD